MDCCPKCGKNIEAHASVGRDSPLAIGDICLCIGCGTPLRIVALPYEMREMTLDELAELEPRQIDIIVRGRLQILRDSGSGYSKG
jgi:hypothetical protein